MNRFFKTGLLTGLFVGTTDLIFAYISVFIQNGKFPEGMLNYIAGGVLGLSVSMKGGNPAALLGLLIHYVIALLFTFFFFWVFPKWKGLSLNKYLVGMLYAVIVHLTMTFLILPLTPLGSGTFVLSRALIDWYSFGVVFGIPIVYQTYKYYRV
jgi:hypothetical protein